MSNPQRTEGPGALAVLFLLAGSALALLGWWQTEHGREGRGLGNIWFGVFLVILGVLSAVRWCRLAARRRRGDLNR